MKQKKEIEYIEKLKKNKCHSKIGLAHSDPMSNCNHKIKELLKKLS